MTGLRVEALGEIPFDEAEILRYALLPKAAPRPEELPLASCLAAAKGAACCMAVWRRFPMHILDSGLDLGFARTASKDLGGWLEGCGEVLLFCCTAGAEMDRRIQREGLRSPIRELLMNAIGAQQVEGACDRLCLLLAKHFSTHELTPRYSPGYGDLPLSLQREVFAALDCERRLGVTLTESLLMRPSKTVTAIVGMKKKAREGGK